MFPVKEMIFVFFIRLLYGIGIMTGMPISGHRILTAKAITSISMTEAGIP